MELVIYTYGYGDAMFSVLNGVKMVINTQFFKLLIQLLASVSVVVAATTYATTRGMNLMARPIIGRIAAIYLVLNLLLVPNVRVWVVDRVGKTKQNVDNLPFAFVPIGWLEGVGDLISGAVEQAFTPVADDRIDEVMRGARFSYRDYGLGFGAQLMREARNWRIQNPEFALNMSNFIRRCVMYDVMIGYKYTQSQLYSSTNAWKLVKDNAGGFTRVTLNIDGRRENLTCYDAAVTFDTRYFTSEIDELKRRNLGNIASSAGSSSTSPGGASSSSASSGGSATETRANRIFMDNIQSAHSNFTGAGNATDIIKQQLMLSALKTFDASHSYGLVRAKMQQESAWLTGGLLAAEYLPIILTLAKCLMYAGLLFLLPMMVLSAGIARFQAYLLAVTSLQLWPALYSILNMFVEMYSSKSIFGASNGIISYATYSAVGQAADKIAAIAGSLQVFIPFISYQIVQGSIGGFIHLAGNITSATQSAANQAASEVTTGNRSLDNVSIGNMQIAMQSGFKTDFNQSYASGSSTFQHADGAMEIATLNNTRAINTSHMKDQGTVSLNLHESVEQGLTQNLEHAQSKLESIQVAKKNATEARELAAVEFLTKATEAKIAGKSINFDTTTEEGRTMEHLVNESAAYAKEKQSIDRGSLQASIRAEIGTPGSSMFNFGISVEGQVSKEINNNDSQRQAVEQQEAFKRNLNAISKMAENQNFLEQVGIDKDTSESVTSTTQEVHEIEKSENQLKEDIKRYSEVLSQHQSSGGSLTTDSNHLAIERLKATHNLTDKEAHDWFHNPATASQRSARDQVAKSIVQQEMNNVMGQNSMGSKVQQFRKDYDSSNPDEYYKNEQQKVKEIHNRNSQEVLQTGKANGVDIDSMNNQVTEREDNLKKRNLEFSEQIDEDIDKGHSRITKNYEQTKNKIEKKLNKNDKLSKLISGPGN